VGRPGVELSVVRQVFPEVSRIVAATPTDRPGTHRITLTLQPAQLGEVRVTLVVRDGAVQVRLSGESDSPAVHRALAAGAPELQRLLERSGATDARVLVREPFGLPTAQAPLPTPAAQAPQPAQQAPPGQPDQGAHQDASHGRHGGAAQHGRRDDRPPQQPATPPPPSPPPSPTATGQLDRNL